MDDNVCFLLICGRVGECMKKVRYTFGAEAQTLFAERRGFSAGIGAKKRRFYNVSQLVLSPESGRGHIDNPWECCKIRPL